MPPPRAQEIAELALSSDRHVFRNVIAERVRAWVGGDGGWFHTIDPRLPLTAGSWVGLDLAHVERARAGWTAYGAELVPLIQTAVTQGAALSTEIFPTRERDQLSFFREVAAPLRIERSLWVGLAGGGHVASIGVSRERGEFRRVPFAALRALVPILTLADRSFEARRLDPPPELSLLSPRERQVVDVLILGYTNAEIALALGVSVNTIRNQLAAIFRKVGVTTRAELVGRALGCR